MTSAVCMLGCLLACLQDIHKYYICARNDACRATTGNTARRLARRLATLRADWRADCKSCKHASDPPSMHTADVIREAVLITIGANTRASRATAGSTLRRLRLDAARLRLDTAQLRLDAARLRLDAARLHPAPPLRLGAARHRPAPPRRRSCATTHRRGQQRGQQKIWNTPDGDRHRCNCRSRGFRREPGDGHRGERVSEEGLRRRHRLEG